MQSIKCTHPCIVDSTRQAGSRTRPDTWDTRAGNRAARRFCRCILCSRRTTDHRRFAAVAHLKAKETKRISHLLFFVHVLQLSRKMDGIICIRSAL
jgi:hypothetical protein